VFLRGMLLRGEFSLWGIRSTRFLSGEVLRGLLGAMSALLLGENATPLPGDSLEFLNGIDLLGEVSK